MQDGFPDGHGEWKANRLDAGLKRNLSRCACWISVPSKVPTFECGGSNDDRQPHLPAKGIPGSGRHGRTRKKQSIRDSEIVIKFALLQTSNRLTSCKLMRYFWIVKRDCGTSGQRGKKHGFGVQRFVTGDWYEGDFVWIQARDLRQCPRMDPGRNSLGTLKTLELFICSSLAGRKWN